jgi:DnaJ domain
VQVDEARQILGVSLSDDPATVRAAYRRLLHRTHPDVSAVADATDRTVRLTQAYTLLVALPREAAPPSPGNGSPPTPAQAPARQPEPAAPSVPPVEAGLVDADTIAVGAPADEVLLLLVDTAHELGEISYLDPSAGLVEVVVEFLEAPTSSVLLSMQGRATGVTDVFCTVEPLSGGDAPPSDAVTRLVMSTLVEVSRSRQDAGAP